MNAEFDIKNIVPFLLPEHFQKVEDAKKNKISFVHYTSADSLLKILSGGMWLRNARFMNDFSEIDHGGECLRKAWNSGSGQEFRKLLDNFSEGFSDKFSTFFDSYNHSRTYESYLFSVGEHGSEATNEDEYGRLSMWRAYGGNVNVAIVLNQTAFFNETDALSAYTVPVVYRTVEQFESYFETITPRISAILSARSGLDPDFLKGQLFWAFHFLTLSIKHPGFEEEKEWRVVYSPNHWKSTSIKSSTEVIQGIPQKVFTLKLESDPKVGLVGLSPDELLKEVIIGPTEPDYEIPLRDAIVAKLEEASVADARSKVRFSGIPLRRN
ncbi:DUF2971 domain-containing protein [Actibacterium sp.]|uniref:DUF2971 domain-containing protein n=1 Tax=Actibacterium sp. TaxID=1872125 RepID=UPI003562B925